MMMIMMAQMIPKKSSVAQTRLTQNLLLQEIQIRVVTSMNQHHSSVSGGVAYFYWLYY